MSDNNHPQRLNWQAQIARVRGSKVRRESEREELREQAQQVTQVHSTAPRTEGIGRPVRVPYVRR